MPKNNLRCTKDLQMHARLSVFELPSIAADNISVWSTLADIRVGSSNGLSLAYDIRCVVFQHEIQDCRSTEDSNEKD